MIYADQDEQRGCVKIISRTALSLMPVLISEIISGCLCLLLGLWTIYVTCHINDRYNNLRSDDELVKVTPTTIPITKYPYYQTNKNVVSEINAKDDQIISPTDKSDKGTKYKYICTKDNCNSEKLWEKVSIHSMRFNEKKWIVINNCLLLIFYFIYRLMYWYSISWNLLRIMMTIIHLIQSKMFLKNK